MKRKLLAMLMGATICISGLSGCGDSGSQTQEPAATSSGQEETEAETQQDSTSTAEESSEPAADQEITIWC